MYESLLIERYIIFERKLSTSIHIYLADLAGPDLLSLTNINHPPCLFVSPCKSQHGVNEMAWQKQSSFQVPTQLFGLQPPFVAGHSAPCQLPDTNSETTKT